MTTYAPPLDAMLSSSSGDITPPPILSTPNLSQTGQMQSHPLIGHTPSHSLSHSHSHSHSLSLSSHRPVLSPNYHVGNVQKSPMQPTTIQAPAQLLPSSLNLGGGPGSDHLLDLESMKVSTYLTIHFSCFSFQLWSFSRETRLSRLANSADTPHRSAPLTPLHSRQTLSAVKHPQSTRPRRLKTYHRKRSVLLRLTTISTRKVSSVHLYRRSI